MDDRDVVLELFAAGERRDIARVLELWDDDVTLHYTGRNPVAGSYSGRDAVLGAYATMGQLTDGTFRRLELHDVLDSVEHVVALVTVGAERQGRELTWRGVDVYHVDNGKITDIWITVEDQYAVDDFLTA